MSKYNRMILRYMTFQANKYNDIIKIDMRNESQVDLSCGMKCILWLQWIIFFLKQKSTFTYQ